MPVFFRADGNEVFRFKRRHTTAGDDFQGFGRPNLPETTVK